MNALCQPRILLAVTIVAVLALPLSTAFAQGRGNGGGKGGGNELVPGGTIYFIHDDDVWTMDSDGSNAAPLMPRGDTWTDPSHLRHGGDRWFVRRLPPVAATPFPNGRSYTEAWVRSETGAEVPLITRPDVEILSPLVWMADDLSVSFVGERWVLDSNGQPTSVVEAGLYCVDVAFDTNGAVTGSVPGSLEFLADLSTELRIDSAGFDDNAEVAGHSWSDDESAFTFGIRTTWEISPRQQEIWIVDLSQVVDPHVVPPGALFLLDSGSGIGWPQWSPDGRRIGYVSWDGTVIYDLLRHRSKTLKRTPNDSWGFVEWSPDGSHFVLFHWDNFSGYDAIYRFSASLTGKAELTDGLCPPGPSFSCVLIPLGWRD